MTSFQQNASLERVLHINDLPPEILAKVFGFVDRNRDRENASKVCQYWEAVMNTTVGVRGWIGKPSKYWKPSEKWLPLIEISRKGFSRCILSNLGSEFLEDFSNMKKELSFRFPNLVTRLEFEGFIESPIHDKILSSPFKSLSVLIFHISTLTYVDLGLKGKSGLQSVTRLAISSYEFNQRDFQNHDMTLVFANLCSICETKFPRLTEFEMECPLFLDKEIELFMKFASFVNCHHQTLTAIDFTWTQRWRVDAMHSGRRTQRELDAVNYALLHCEEALCRIYEVQKWKMKSIVCIIEDEEETIFPTSLALKHAILNPNQTSLEKMYYMCWDYIEMPVNCINNNANQLTEIGLTVNDISQPIDCAVFSGCRNLTHLSLHADGSIVFRNLAQETPRLQNAQSLPLTLKDVRFRNVYIEAQSVEFLAKGLPKLQTLLLTNIGTVGDLGASMYCIRWILRESRTIKKLKIKGLNSYCYFATFAFSSLIQPPKCPTCKLSHSRGGDLKEGLICQDDKELMQSLFSETDRKSKFLPLIVKNKDGRWEPC